MTTDAIHPGSDGPVEYLLPGTGESGEGFHWMPGTLIEGGIEAETRQALANIDAILRAAGGSLRDLVKVNTFLRDVDRDFHAYNRVYSEIFPVRPPARTTVQSKIYGPLLVEIEGTAYLPLK